MAGIKHKIIAMIVKYVHFICKFIYNTTTVITVHIST
jgi:hypothetical protein